nr:MAG TPA: hypothetical protein [Caudoviricetes sp.]
MYYKLFYNKTQNILRLLLLCKLFILPLQSVKVKTLHVESLTTK